MSCTLEKNENEVVVSREDVDAQLPLLGPEAHHARQSHPETSCTLCKHYHSTLSTAGGILEAASIDSKQLILFYIIANKLVNGSVANKWTQGPRKIDKRQGSG